MKKLLLSGLFLIFLNNHVQGSENCEEFSYVKNQCEFNFTETKNGNVTSSEYSDELFSGTAMALCKKGKYIIKKAVCEEKQKHTCDYVTSTTWNNNNVSCSHGMKELNLKEKEIIKVFSNENKGYITYQCFNGRLQGIEQSCEKRESAKFSPKAVNTNTETFNMFYNLELCPEPSGGQSYCDPDPTKSVSMCESKCSAEGYTDSIVSNESIINTKRVDFNCNCSKKTETSQCSSFNTPQYSQSGTSADQKEYTVKQCLTGVKDGNSYLEPSDSDIEKICESVPDRVAYSSHTMSQNSNEFTYTVKCIANNNYCPINHTQVELGDRDTALKSGLPNYFCDGEICYYCVPDEPEDVNDSVCATCELNSVTFSSNDNKNSTCSVKLGGEEVYSGDTKNKEFHNDIYNGQVSYYCMNGLSEVKSETCYLNCDSVSNITWSDEGADSYYLGLDKTNKCFGDINVNDVKNKKRSPVINTKENTGSAIFYCNGYNGKWVKDKERCKLDCPATVYWPDSTNTNINDKAGRKEGYIPRSDTQNDRRLGMACSYTFPSGKQKHGTIETVIADGSRGNERDPSETTTAQCIDGYWEISNPVCNLHCNGSSPRKAVTDSQGNRCVFESTSLPRTRHGGKESVSNSYVKTVGSADFRCNDGRWDFIPSSVSCAPKICDHTVQWEDPDNNCRLSGFSGSESQTKTAWDVSYPASGGWTGRNDYKCVGYETNTGGYVENAKWIDTTLNSSQCIYTFDGACKPASEQPRNPDNHATRFFSENEICERSHSFEQLPVGNNYYRYKCLGKEGVKSNLGKDIICSVPRCTEQNACSNRTPSSACGVGTSEWTAVGPVTADDENRNCNEMVPALTRSCPSGFSKNTCDCSKPWDGTMGCWFGTEEGGMCVSEYTYNGETIRNEYEMVPMCDEGFYSGGSCVTQPASYKCPEGDWVLYGDECRKRTDFVAKCDANGVLTCKDLGTCPIDGACNENEPYKCAEGSSDNQQLTSSTTEKRYTWTCKGSYGGKDDSCEKIVSINTNGKCNNAVKNSCEEGTVINKNEKTNMFTWDCQGVGSGLNDNNCTFYKEPVCDIANESCTIGTKRNYKNNSGNITWDCENNTKITSCSTSQNPECVDYSGQQLTEKPTDLCVVGKDQSFTTNTGEYIWTCNVGTDFENCSAKRKDNVLNGECSAVTYNDIKNNGENNITLCNTGNKESFTSETNSYTWTCTGSGDGSIDASCSVTLPSSGCNLAHPAGWYANGNYCSEYYLAPGGDLTYEYMNVGQTKSLMSKWCDATGGCEGSATIKCNGDGSITFSNEICKEGEIK